MSELTDIIHNKGCRIAELEAALRARDQRIAELEGVAAAIAERLEDEAEQLEDSRPLSASEYAEWATQLRSALTPPSRQAPLDNSKEKP
jgi:hypothetical protein